MCHFVDVYQYKTRKMDVVNCRIIQKISLVKGLKFTNIQVYMILQRYDKIT